MLKDTKQQWFKDWHDPDGFAAGKDNSKKDEVFPKLGWFWKTSCGFSPKGCETRFFIGSFPKN
jgi:hypothetical protein